MNFNTQRDLDNPRKHESWEIKQQIPQGLWNVYRVLKGGGGNWGTLRITSEDWGNLGKIRGITTPP